MSEPALFDTAPALEPPAGPTPAERRRRRQADAIAHGHHPLGASTRTTLRLHPQAAAHRGDPGRRCGNCRHRQAAVDTGSARRWPAPAGRGRPPPGKENAMAITATARKLPVSPHGYWEDRDAPGTCRRCHLIAANRVHSVQAQRDQTQAARAAERAPYYIDPTRARRLRDDLDDRPGD